jgi:hypothetical protein
METSGPIQGDKDTQGIQPSILDHGKGKLQILHEAEIEPF